MQSLADRGALYERAATTATTTGVEEAGKKKRWKEADILVLAHDRKARE